MDIFNDISDLVKDKVISEETATRLIDYYNNKQVRPTNWLFIVFGILGAILVGLGIILIIAHNWDQLSISFKSIIAFCPLVIGQLACGYVLVKRKNDVAWRESAASFLFFTVGACISLISQIYHINGDLGAFILTWMLLCLPLVYLMKSSVVSLFYTMGITYFACTVGYWTHPIEEPYLYWLLLLLIFPHYYRLYKETPISNFTIFHHWTVPVSVVIVLGTVIVHSPELILIAYFSLFGLFYLIGHMDHFISQKLRNNSFIIIGAVGTFGMLLLMSFDFIWDELRKNVSTFEESVQSPELVTSAILSILGLSLLYRRMRDKELTRIKPMMVVFLLFPIIYVIGQYSSLSVFLINLLTIIIGLFTIREGEVQDHLGILNFGLLMITALIICRFFDTNISFIIKGILFVSVGVGFFLTNYFLLKKRKANEV